MATFTIAQEGDKVVIDLSGRRRDLLLSCKDAERFEWALRHCADAAELAPPELIRGQVWDVRVRSYDGLVAVRFLPPFAGNAERVPIPYKSARELADLVEFKREQAAYRMEFRLRNG